MVKLEELKMLEKQSEIDVRKCSLIAERYYEGDMLTRIYSCDERYYFYQVKRGKGVKCFEIALSWRPFGNQYVFAFTPDNLHIYEIDSTAPAYFNVKKLKENNVTTGMKCTYNGGEVEYISENELSINGRIVPVVRDSNYTYKLLKTKIRAQNGAMGLFIFLENIAEESKQHSYPLFSDSWNMIMECYGN